jgi:tetratricopeptide (TPR) repeat protein
MSERKLILLCAFMMLMFMTSTARSQQVTGQVRFADTNQAAFNVNVHCNGTGTSQIQQTDRSGKFRCTLGSTGSFSVRVDADGYVPEEQSGNAIDTFANEYMLFRLKRIPGAKPSLSTVSVADSNIPPAARKAFDSGVEAIASGKKDKIEEGVQSLEQAVNLYPKFVDAYMQLGAAYMDLQKWDKAAPAFTKALELDPKAANAFFALGEIYLREKKFEDAEKNLLQGLQLAETSAPAHLTLGRTYWEMGSKIKETEQARPLLDKSYAQAKRAIELNPNVAEAHLLKGNLLFRARRAADAQHEYEEYLRLDPKGRFADQTRAIVERIKKALAEVKQ